MNQSPQIRAAITCSVIQNYIQFCRVDVKQHTCNNKVCLTCGEKHLGDCSPRCPNCLNPVIRQQHNNTIICECTYSFCWICSSTMSDFHYEFWNFCGCPIPESNKLNIDKLKYPQLMKIVMILPRIILFPFFAIYYFFVQLQAGWCQEILNGLRNCLEWWRTNFCNYLYLGLKYLLWCLYALMILILSLLIIILFILFYPFAVFILAPFFICEKIEVDCTHCCCLFIIIIAFPISYIFFFIFFIFEGFYLTFMKEILKSFIECTKWDPTK